MKLTIESTDRIVQIETGLKLNSIACRVWEGETESGVKVTVLVPRIAAHKDQDLTQFERELQETKPPTPTAVEVFPLKMLI